MKTYKVQTSERALADMESIYDYIDEVFLSPSVAMKLYDRIADKILKLDTFPEAHSLFDCQPEHDLGIRRTFVDNYTIIFVVRDDVVTVLRVLYSASDIIARLRGDG